jgi:hypothetical protein
MYATVGRPLESAGLRPWCATCALDDRFADALGKSHPVCIRPLRRGAGTPQLGWPLGWVRQAVRAGRGVDVDGGERSAACGCGDGIDVDVAGEPVAGVLGGVEGASGDLHAGVQRGGGSAIVGVAGAAAWAIAVSPGDGVCPQITTTCSSSCRLRTKPSCSRYGKRDRAIFPYGP